MMFSRRVKLLVICIIVVVVLILSHHKSILKINIPSGLTLSSDVVPDIVHYILFNDHNISFVHFISLLSVLKNQKPELIYIHCDCHQLSGDYWQRALRVSNRTKTSLVVRYVDKPNEIFGHKLKKNNIDWHASDVMRIRVLQEFGGVYLDRDVYVVKPLNTFFKYEMTIDLDGTGSEGLFINAATLIATKNSRFLGEWLDQFRHFNASQWSFLIQSGTRLVKQRPDLVHRVKLVFAADGPLLCPILFNAHEKNWQTKYYTIHMFIRGNNVTLPNWCFQKLAKQPAVRQFDETNIYRLNTTFAEMARNAFDFEKRILFN